MIKKKLLMVCLLIAAIVFSSFKKDKTYKITDFGAKGDGQTLNTASIQEAIDKCSAEGGGTLIIPEGVFLSGSIFLKQGVSMLLEEGAVLKGSLNQEDYPQINTRWEGEEKKWTACLVNAIDLSNFKISGKGTIDGSGDAWTARGRSAQQSPGPRYGRPRLIGLQNCKNAVVEHIKLNNQASWGLFVLYSRNVKIKGLTIRAAHNIPSSDGIDIDSSKDILITGCDIDVNDDCISIKSGKDEDGLRVNRPCEDVLIEKCRFGYGHGGVAMGSETSGGIRNITVRNCVFEAGNWAPIRFKSQPSRGGVVENITYKNLIIRDTRQAFEFNMAWRMVNPKPPAKVLPIVRNVRIINVRGTARTVGTMKGLEQSPIDGVKFKNCEITAQRGFSMEHATNVDLSGLKILGVTGEAIMKTNVR
ncbi:glycoside hydrolase family 28 protein [Paradesertivirga mongoliensis]|uniref:Glycoside hydrolase family 28 protein n=1 Tax=Paradesertivirga mongoliensis TaxID=2100740 RepID=A0ABW4ZPN2_9SPHI|nr:glycoside hydrolase family 28 protein [Pedobacter mongoliensis]